MSGAVSYLSGLAAEKQVAQRYIRKGGRLRNHRWRGRGGEIDLVIEDGPSLVFVEVKKAKDLARAAERVSARQLRRIYNAAAEYLGQLPKGQDTLSRFDIALVDGAGRMEILENAYCH